MPLHTARMSPMKRHCVQSAGGENGHSHLDSIIEGTASGAALPAPNAKDGDDAVASTGVETAWYRIPQVGASLLGLELSIHTSRDPL